MAILAAGVTIGAGGVQGSGIYRLDPARPGIASPVYESSGAERAPIYIHSSPTGREAGVLLTGTGGLGFGLVDVAGGLVAENLDRVLVPEVVGALHRVERVDLGAVLRRIPERGVDPALGRA
jgi:hypothetical protein